MSRMLAALYAIVRAVMVVAVAIKTVAQAQGLVNLQKLSACAGR